ncbi:DUF3558 domain-containing protein [Nocardia carnea]|uniref:DUF3558 domain-containing protein n=1 Tax=Nocardia carnea TaxID=37328 RepID=UPI002453A774|nr:DUF3558 domain-containing protein [Nocardia carnea]
MIAGKRRLVIALVGGAALALTGCESSTGGSAAPVTPSLAPDVPAGFNPCTDVPQSVLDSEGLKMPTADDTELSSGAKWRGCIWASADGYAVGIQTTNLTLDMVREKNFPETEEFTLGARRALSTRRAEGNPEESCYVNIEMTGGSLQFRLTNPASAPDTGHLDSCELARTLAGKVEPSIPAGV